MENRKCVQCGKIFQISDSEKDFYMKKSLQIPKRCNECRKKNNPQNGHQKNSTQQYQGHRNNQAGITKSKKSSNIMSVVLLLASLLVLGIFYFSDKIEETILDQRAQQETDYNQQQEIAQTPQVADVTQVEDTTQVKDATQAEVATQVEEVQKEEDTTKAEEVVQSIEGTSSVAKYSFRNVDLLEEHFTKHGNEFGFETSLQYESGANAVIFSPDALTKKEAEDGDSIYYLESTNEIVFLSSNGFIRTYFKPEGGIEYYNRQ